MKKPIVKGLEILYTYENIKGSHGELDVILSNSHETGGKEWDKEDLEAMITLYFESFRGIGWITIKSVNCFIDKRSKKSKEFQNWEALFVGKEYEFNNEAFVRY